MTTPAQKSFRCEILTWNKIIRDAKTLAKLVKQSGYKPDIVIAIGRGGYVPARIICDFMMLRDLTSVKAEHWGSAEMDSKEAVIKFPICTEIRGKKVLLVDDVTDTGRTLIVTLEYLKGLAPAEIRTAILIHKTCSEIVPDYYVNKIVRWKWLIFPWHVWEDLNGFVKRLLEAGITREEEIKAELQKRFSLDVKTETIREILSELGAAVL
jgi:hypoxanthine phosphoribosyltransferase